MFEKILTSVWPTKSSLVDNSEVRHGFDAKASLPLTPAVSYTTRLLLAFCHIIGILDQDTASSYNSLLYSWLSSYEGFIQWCKI